MRRATYVAQSVVVGRVLVGVLDHEADGGAKRYTFLGIRLKRFELSISAQGHNS